MCSPPFPFVFDPCADAVSHNFCLGCGLCALNCPRAAIVMEEQTAGEGQPRRNPGLRPQLCVHCGRCAAVCPSGAIQQVHMEDVTRRVRATRSHAVAFFCVGLNLLTPTPWERGVIPPDMPLADARLRPRLQDVDVPEGVLLEEVRCTGRLGARLLWRLLLAGARDLAFFACPPHKCQYGGGGTGIAEHADAVRDLLEQYGIRGVRLRVHAGVEDAERLAAVLADMGRLRTQSC